MKFSRALNYSNEAVRWRLFNRTVTSDTYSNYSRFVRNNVGEKKKARLLRGKGILEVDDFFGLKFLAELKL